jgi:hypothetical protein
MRTKGLAILIALALSAGAFANTASPPTTLELIGSAYERGELTYTDYALYKLYLAFGDADRIPDAYRGDDSLAGVCGTMLIYDANMCVLKGLFDESDLADAQLYLGRPTQEGTPGAIRGYDILPQDIHHWDTPEGNFRMWWAGVGPHALWHPQDDDHNGVPDIVEVVAAGLEHSFGLFLDTDWLGFDYPVRDGTWYPEGADYGYCDGDTEADWSRFDAYFRSMGEDGMDSGVMAYCQYDYYYEPTPRDDASFHMAFHNTPDPGSISDEEKTTAAHELNHGFQGGIDVDSPSHHKEKTSVWSEERAYPLANDYQQGRIGAFMLTTNVGLTRQKDLSWYNGTIWNHYIESLFYEDPALMTYLLNDEGRKDAIPMFWENYELRKDDGTEYDFNDGYDALFRSAYPDMEFEDNMGGLAYAYGQFVEWNWFTGIRSAARSGNSANNHGFYYIDDLNNTGHSFSNSGFTIDFPAESTAVAYDEVNDIAPDGTREFTGAQVVSGVEIDMNNETVNINGCPDGLGAVYMHIVQLGPIPEDVVYAFKGYPDNEEDSKFWGGSYILMQSDSRQHQNQTEGGTLTTKMNIFGDKGIIRVNNASQYHEIAFIPYVRRDVGSALQFLVRIDAVDSSDRLGPSFDTSRGGALQLAMIPGLGSHIEFTATPSERLFACPRYDIHFTEVDANGDPVGTHFWEIDGFQNGDYTFRTWGDGPSIYTAYWTLPEFDGTADIDVTASDLGGNIGTTSFEGVLSQADVGEDGAVIGRDAPATLEIPAGAVDPGARVLVMGRPDISGGLLDTLALSSAPTDAKVVASPAALGRKLAGSVSAGAAGAASAPDTGELGLHVVGYAYELTGDRPLTGVSTLKLSYDASQVPSEDKLALYRWDDELGRWRHIAAEFDRQSDEAFAAVDSYGLYAVGYAESVEIPQEIDSSRYTFSLDQNFPNPFLAASGETTINFSLPSDSHVRLAVYDLSGRLITTLVDDTLTAGRHTLGWDGTTSRGTGVESGVYFYKIDTDNNSATRRLVLVR